MQFSSNRYLAYGAVEHSGMPCNFACMKIRLAEFRKRADLTLEEMAERVGVSDSQLSRWEKGRSSIPSKRLPALAEAYGCRISEIFVEESDPSDLVLTADQLVGMVRTAQDELRAGTTFADWPRAVGISLHGQLKQIQAAGGLRVSTDQAILPDKGDQPRSASSRPTQGN